MSDADLGISYWLPTTDFAVDLVKRHQVITRDEGTYEEPVVDVSVQPGVAADLSSRRTLFIDAGILEKLSLTINLDDRGFIIGINGEAGHDITPVLSAVGKAIGVAGTILAMGVTPLPDVVPQSRASLEVKWASKNPGLEACRSELVQRVGELLAKLADKSAEPADVVQVGAALEVLQSQLASISEVRRGWIANHARTLESNNWQLNTDDLYRFEHDLPDTASLQLRQLPTKLREMARCGALVAVADISRGSATPPGEEILYDKIALRRSRPVSIGVYLKNTDGNWELDRPSIQHLDIVDEHSQLDYLPIDGSWLRTKTFELAYHPDMSVKTFGLASTSSVSAIASSVGGIADSALAARKQIAERPSLADKELERAKAQLDLLKATSEYEVLSSTRARASELAVLEQQKKFRDAVK